MKKFYLVLCSTLLCFASQARELTFYIGDTPIENGATVEFTDINVEDYGDYKEVTMAPALYVSTDLFTNALSVTATCTSGQTIQLCAGGNCQAGTTVTKSNVTISTNQKLPLQFEYIAELDGDEEVPVVTAKIEAQDGTYEATYKSYTIVMGKQTGVTLIENSPELTYAEGAFEYNLTAPEAFALYNTVGLQVLGAQLEGHGTLAADGLTAGIYVYTLGSKTGKIYVK